MIDNHIKIRYSNINNSEELSKALQGCEILLNIASLGFGASESILSACEKNKIKRAVFISSTSIFTHLNSISKKTRTDAEEKVQSSKLCWTILRPTMIYGSPSDRNIIKLIKWIDKIRILPIFGNGCSLQKPVHVKDVAWSVVKVINTKSTFYRSFNISGANPYTFNQVINFTATALRKKVIKLYLPSKFFELLLKCLEYLGIYLPIKSEQIKRLNENKNFSNKEAREAFNFKPIDFEKGIQEEVELYKKKHKIINTKFN